MKNLKTCIKGLGKMFRPVWKRVLVSVLTGFVRIAASLSFVWISKRLVDIATGRTDADLRQHICLMCIIMAVQVLVGLFARWWENYNVVKTQNAMRYDSFSHVLRSEWNGLERFSTGDTVNRLEEDIRVIVDLVCSRIPNLVVTVCQLLAASIYLFKLAPNLLWVLLVLTAVAVVGSRLFFKTFRKLTERIRRKDSEVQQHMQENLLNRVLVLTLFGTERVLEKLGILQKDIYDNTVKRLNYNAIARGFMSFGFTFGYGAAFIWSIVGIKDGTVTYGMMTAFLQLVGQVQRPIAELAANVPAFIHAMTSVERLMELEELPLEAEEEPVVIENAPALSLKDVSFAYDGKNQVLDHFSYEFEAGSLCAVMGPTGVGKSTLIRLLMGLLKPSSGTVEIGGIRAGAQTRCNFMYVPQGNTLMSGTIRENLLLANGDADEAMMRRALETAAADFVFGLPDGLDTRCGEEGAGLSEGQSQRISIARALLQKGSVLILDEATSSLDSETEKRLLDNLFNEYHGRKTIIFITHRDAVGKACDKVLKM